MGSSVTPSIGARINTGLPNSTIVAFYSFDIKRRVTNSNNERNGVLCALGAYTAWGLFPAFWKLLQHVPSVDILAHRVIWTFVFYALVLRLWFRSGSPLAELSRALRAWRRGLAAAVLIAANWGFYVWGVNSGQVLETSLGYFINPLVNVLLGTVFLKERMRAVQWICIALAAIGVTLLALRGPAIPWLALFLATSFGLYGLMRKQMKADPIAASTLEAFAMAVPAALFLFTPFAHPVISNGTDGAMNLLLLVLGGAVTGIPLLLFNAAAKQLPLSMLGFFQYIAPSMQFCLAVFAFGEPFLPVHAQAFGLIWIALAIYSIDLASHRARSRSARLARA